MTKNEVYKCHEGITLELMGDGKCTDLSCCGQPMELLKEKTSADEGKEKHVPVIHEGQEGAKICVGSTPHPMTFEHHIEWIEIINGDYVNRKYLAETEDPEAEFYVPIQEGMVVRAYCNKHGLWRA